MVTNGGGSTITIDQNLYRYDGDHMQLVDSTSKVKSK